MKFTPNKYFIIILLFIGTFGFAKQGPPPPNDGTPPPPGFPIDANIYLLIFFAVIFSFLYFRNHINSGKKI